VPSVICTPFTASHKAMYSTSACTDGVPFIIPTQSVVRQGFRHFDS
jgi:hypothetical protein